MENEIIAYMEGRGDDIAPPPPSAQKAEAKPAVPPYATV
jgi:hypothetical protein